MTDDPVLDPTNQRRPSGPHTAAKVARALSFIVAALFLVPSLMATSSAEGVPKAQYFFRNPTGHGSTVVFEFYGHIWRQDGGGVAKRVTNAETDETAPILSPDGLRVAYVALGNSSDEVFMASLTSGESTRLTSNGGFNVKVQGWLGTNEVLYSTTANSGKRGPLLFAVNIQTLRSRAIPLSEVAEGCVLGSHFIFVKNQELIDHNRLYSGGYAQRINKIDYNVILGRSRVELDGKTPSVALTGDYRGISRNPLCIGNRIFFLSDRDQRFNIWSMGADGGDLVQHTFEREFDIRSMTTSDGAVIFYQRAGEIFRLDVTGGSVSRHDINIPHSTLKELKRFAFEPADATQFAVSDEGTRAILVIRGKLWAVEGGTAICVDCHSDRRVKSPALSSDGQTVFAMHDASGEYDIFAYDLRDGSVKPIGHRISEPILDFSLSPNGRDIVVRSIAGDLYHVDTADGVTARIDLISVERPTYVSWSPDGRLVTFVTYPVDSISRIAIFDTVCGNVAYLTNGQYEVSAPVFSRDSTEVYYVAGMNFRSSLDDTWNPTSYWPSYENKSLIYAVDVRSSVGWHSDSRPTSTFNSATARREAFCPGRLPERGASRDQVLLTRELPFVAGNYDRLLLIDGQLHAFSKRAVRDRWGRIVAFDRGLHGGRRAPQHVFNEEIYEYAISAKNRSVITRTSRGLFISSANGSGEFRSPIRLAEIAGLEVQIDLASEREQRFNELWRMYRDYFFDPKMNGVDWVRKREKYRVFLSRVSNEIEFGQVVADMISELGAGHTALGIAAPDPKGRQGMARLGGEFDDADHLRVLNVFDGDLDVMEERSPLSSMRPPVNVGDRILRINGVEVSSRLALDKILYGRVGEPLTLAVEKPDGQVHESRVVPISAGHEAWLRYKSWTASNSRKVDELSGGSVGYIHLQSAYEADFSNFIRQYGYLHQRDALILDLRGNNGGNIDPWILNFLQRRTWLYVTERYNPKSLRYPRRSFAGKLVVLIDGDTYSNGELIAEGVRRLQLGILIGTRTSGAGKWVNDDKTLIDGSKVRIPEAGVYVLDAGKARWVIEGHGVEPDIQVENDPYLVFFGADAQLQAAVDYAMGAQKR
jgi:tricorn protease